MIPEKFRISQLLQNGDFLAVNEDTGVSPKLAGMALVQRHPTMPMTKRDSLVMTGSRLSLISVGSTSNQNQSRDQSRVEESSIRDLSLSTNTHPEMIAGKKRSPKKVKRTDSYKKATNRQSQFDNLEELPVIVVNPDVAKRRGEDKQKYNTLPINTAQPTCNGETTHRKKRPSGNSDSLAFQRNASQKSGTYPSPDTDDDQRSIQPERKKKSAFKKFKERLITTIRRDSHSQSVKKSKKSHGHNHGAQSVVSKHAGRVRPNDAQTVPGFHTPSENSAIAKHHQTLQNGHHLDSLNGSIQTLTPSEHHDHADDHSDGKKNGNGLMAIIRRSFRKKQSPGTPELRTSKKGSSDSRPSSSELHSSSPRLTSTQHRPTTHGPKTSAPVHIPSRQKTPERAIDEEEEDDFFGVDDTITAIFGSIIEPRKRSYAGALGSRVESGARADRTQLRLDGLRKCRPKSFEKKCEPQVRTHGYYGNQYFGGDLSPTVDIDGLDCADGLSDQQPRGAGAESLEDEATRVFYEVSQEEKQRRIDEVARTLAALGDRIAAEKEFVVESSGSDLEGHRVGRCPHRLNSLERSLRNELLHYADTQFTMGQGTSVAINLMPAVKNIIAAQDYSNFQQIMKQELSHTHGWDQVAWYTYLIQTAVCIAETGVGSEVKKRAKKYFNAVFTPWIKSRPNGWESIHEETDIDSELD